MLLLPPCSFSLDLFEAKPMTAAPSLPPTWCRISRETKAARYRSLLAELITSDARKFLWGCRPSACAALGVTRVTVPVVGLPGENAFFTPPDFRKEITTIRQLPYDDPLGHGKGCTAPSGKG